MPPFWSENPPNKSYRLFACPLYEGRPKINVTRALRFLTNGQSDYRNRFSRTCDVHAVIRFSILSNET